MKSATRSVKDGHQKNVVRSFDHLSQRHTRWSVWADFVVISAISISNAVDRVNSESRSKMYQSIVTKYNAQELGEFGQMLSEVVLGMEENIDQDFLGELFMALELGNDHNGQFFTPYCVCTMMARMSSTNLKERIEKDHWISVNDCACGAGALLLAFANECQRQEVNYQTSVLFVAQDIDLISGCMCYIQLSFLGCSGYVVVGDSLRNPATSYDRRGLLPRGGENVWYTPLYFMEIWHWRKLFAQLDLMCQNTNKAPESREMLASPEPPIKTQQPDFKVTKNGQLTLF